MWTRLPLVAVAVVLTLTGCGGSGSDETPSGTSEADALKAKTLAREQKREKAARQKAAEARMNSGSAVTRKIDKMLAALPGEGGLVVGAPGGDGARLGDGANLSSISAWSTIKVPIS